MGESCDYVNGWVDRRKDGGMEGGWKEWSEDVGECAY